MKKLLLIAALSFGLAACGEKSTEKVQGAMLVPPAVEEKSIAMADVGAQAADHYTEMETNKVKGYASAAKLAALNNIEAKIIKEGEISFETDNISNTRKAILSALKNTGGYVTQDNESLNGEENRKEYTLDIRVPAKSFDTFIGSVTESATHIDSKNISIRDITTEYIDTKTRLDNKKALEQRYLALLKQAGKISDMLEIESKLTDIRSDIESTQGQLNYMNKQVSYSSLSITFYTKQAAQVASGNGFSYKFKQALSGGLNFLQGLFFGIVALWPLWVVILVITLFVMAKTKGRNRKITDN